MSAIRRWVFFCGLVIAVPTAGAACWLCRPGCISYPNYLRIKTGMTVAEVQALMGRPGEECSWSNIDPKPEPGYAPNDRYFWWYEPSNSTEISVRFTADGRVAEKDWWQPSM